eukprot:6413798-Amphidinium_carterae.1
MQKVTTPFSRNAWELHKTKQDPKFGAPLGKIFHIAPALEVLQIFPRRHHLPAGSDASHL